MYALKKNCCLFLGLLLSVQMAYGQFALTLGFQISASEKPSQELLDSTLLIAKNRLIAIGLDTLTFELDSQHDMIFVHISSEVRKQTVVKTLCTPGLLKIQSVYDSNHLQKFWDSLADILDENDIAIQDKLVINQGSIFCTPQDTLFIHRAIRDAQFRHPSLDSLQFSYLGQAQGSLELLFLKGEPWIMNPYIAKLFPKIDPYGNPTIQLKFNQEGKERFAQISREHLKKRLAFLLDGRVLLCPTVQEEITGGEVSITGHELYKYVDLRELTSFLQAGQLPFYLVFYSEEVYKK